MMKKIFQKPVWTLILVLLIGVLLLFSVAFTVYAEVSDFVLNWWSVDGGGGSSQGGDFTLNGTIGQSDVSAMSGGGYTLHGGFLPGGALSPQYELYLPVVMR